MSHLTAKRKTNDRNSIGVDLGLTREQPQRGVSVCKGRRNYAAAGP